MIINLLVDSLHEDNFPFYVVQTFYSQFTKFMNLTKPSFKVRFKRELMWKIYFVQSFMTQEERVLNNKIEFQ